MTAWILIMFVSMFGEYAIPSIASEAECRALYARIERTKNPRYEPDVSRAQCIPYEVVK